MPNSGEDLIFRTAALLNDPAARMPFY